MICDTDPAVPVRDSWGIDDVIVSITIDFSEVLLQKFGEEQS